MAIRDGRNGRLCRANRQPSADYDRPCLWIGRHVESLLDNGQAPRRIAIIGHLTYAQVVILENFKPALLLYTVVFALRAPAYHGLFIAPGR